MPWITSGGWRGIAVLVAVVVQCAVPFVALTMDPPTRLGFQMYSGLGGIEVSTVDGSGESARVDLDAVTAEFRPELDFSRPLAAHLCQRSDDTVAVVVRDASETRSMPCDR